MRDSLETTAARMRAIAKEPPWPLRVLGALVISYDTFKWISESTPTTLLELIKHGLLLLVGLLMCYPEGASRITIYAGRLIPGGRRSTDV